MKRVRETISQETLFFDDFDNNSIGLNAGPFDSWSTGSNSPPGFAEWSVFSGDDSAEQNLTPGNGSYAAIRTHNADEFGDAVYWLVSPLIDTRKFKGLALSFDIHYRPSGAGRGESTLRIMLLRAGDSAESIGIIGESSSGRDNPTSERMTWNIWPSAAFIRLAFVYYNSSENPAYDSIQLDNIKITGTRGWPNRPPRPHQPPRPRM
jgi:hypothetical protein